MNLKKPSGKGSPDGFSGCLKYPQNLRSLILSVYSVLASAISKVNIVFITDWAQSMAKNVNGHPLPSPKRMFISNIGLTPVSLWTIA